MRTKDIFIGFISIVIIFLSYYLLRPMGQSIPISEKNYSLKTENINKENTSSMFIKEENGTFFIHPGIKKNSIGVFTFKGTYGLSLDFWLKEGSISGNVEFNITKNGLPLKSIIVTPKDTQHLSISVDKKDELEIKADKHGRINYDWGQMKISIQESSLLFKNFIIPFLWSILFIFLWGKKHTCLIVLSYILFLLMVFAEKLNFGSLSFNNLQVYTIFLFSLVFTFVFVYQELSKFKKYKIATIFSFSIIFLVYSVPLFFIIYAFSFDTKITKDILFAVFQTNNEETYEFISTYISLKYLILFIFFTTFMGYLLYQQEKKETVFIEKSLLIVLIITFFSISMTQFSQLRLFNFVRGYVHTYTKELNLFKYTQTKRKTGAIKYTATKRHKGETYIIIIGESLNKKHMGIYGYMRNTTPHLSDMMRTKDLIVFQNIYSNHTHTVPVLSLALTEANQYNKKSYYDSLSIIDILKKADIETYWLTNQNIYGAWDNMISVIGTSADYLTALNRHIGKQIYTNNYDGALIDKVQELLSKKTNKNRVIFVHLMGNHAYYKMRYPHKKYTIFHDILKKGEFGKKASSVEFLNDYDNSIVYNDFVVSSILDKAQKNKNVFGVLYMPDHAEDVIDKLGHNSSRFTYHMTQIPMIAWFSDIYKKRYSNQYNNLLYHTDTLFSNDMLYDTMIGIFGVDTNRYNQKYDFSSNEYKLNPKDALTLHGEQRYIDKSNHIFWQKKNTKYLINSHQSSRIFPNSVDSIGKLKDIWNDGFRSFELDVNFVDIDKSYFLVEHNAGESDMKLDDFLSSIDTEKISRVWLDFKNLTVENLTEVEERLNYLDDKYHLKSKFIIESEVKDSFFKKIKLDGWHTSYSLPTRKIVKLLAEKNKVKMKALAKSIAIQTTLQDISAVSFDNRLYPFVKQYLEPLIHKDVVYHIRYAPALFDLDFIQKLKKNKLYKDKRVKTLLAPYDSQFNI